MCSISTQTSFQNGKFIQIQNAPNTCVNVNTDEKRNENKKTIKEDNTTIDKLKAELEEARDKIKLLEEERMEADKRRSIEILSKYVPTSYPRPDEYFSLGKDLLVNSPRVCSSTQRNGGGSFGVSKLQSRSSLDYFIAGVRQKVEDLCGCNDELIRPLNETSSVPLLNSNSPKNVDKQSRENSRKQEPVKSFSDGENAKVKNVTRLSSSNSF